MKIITCCKLVVDERSIIVRSDSTLDMAHTRARISQLDLNAIETAVQLAQTQHTVIALSAGGHLLNKSTLCKDILSRGPHELHLVRSDRLEQSSPKETARALALAATKIGFDLIIFGEGSDDAYAQQVGLLVGELLQLPTLNGVSDISIEDNKVVIQRTLEHDVEVLHLPLPAVLCVTADINVPKSPTMSAILAAGKKPIVTWKEDDIGLCPSSPEVETVTLRASNQTERKGIILDSTSPDTMDIIVEHLCNLLNLAS